MNNPLVLVVDDDPDLRAFLTEALELEGYEVVSAVSGRDALDCLDRNAPLVMLLDIQMPVLDGRAVLQALEERPDRPGVIVMSAEERLYDWCRESGADACLAKPFSLTSLLDTVERVHHQVH